MNLLITIGMTTFCGAACWAFGKIGVWLDRNKKEDYDFYDPTNEEKPNYYAFDERGQAFLRTWHEDYRTLL